MSYCQIFAYNDTSLPSIMSGSDSSIAGNVVLGSEFTAGGMKDNQGSAALDSSKVFNLLGGRNTWRVIAMVAGSGGLAVATGGVLVISASGGTTDVVLDTSFSAGPSVWGVPQTQVIDLGEFSPSGSFTSGFVGQCPVTFRLYGGASLAQIIFIPNCVRLDETFTFGDPASGGLLAFSSPTTGPAYSVSSPLGGLVEYFFAFHGSTVVSAAAPAGATYGGGARFPVINVPPGGSDLNFYGDEWQIAGDSSGGYDVTVALGDTISADYEEYYQSWNGYSGLAPLSWFGDPASATIDRFWFTIGTYPVFAGPPFINTEHRAYLLDENTDGDSGTVVGSGTPPTGTAPIFDTIHRAYQSDEGTDS